MSEIKVVPLGAGQGIKKSKEYVLDKWLVILNLNFRCW
jgi:hypothetical protein